jgi:ABC-type transporter Mla subunit MlaD
MPLLGFVGTVYGVSYGIGGFAEFLKGKDVTPELMKYHVSEITLGLAVAFYCTLLGLLTAGIAAFPSLRAERKEEGVLGEIEEFVEDRLISQMPSTQGETQIKFPIDELAKAIDLGFSRLPNPDKYEEVFSRAVTRAGDIINQKYSEFTTNYERKVGELGSQMGGKLEAVANSFNASTQRLAQQIGDQSQRLAQGLTDLESRQGQRLESLLEDMKELAQQMPEEFRKAQERYLHQQAETERKSAGSLEELAEQISEVGKEQAKQLGEAHERYLDAIADLDKKELARWEKMISDFNQMSVRLAEQFKQSVGTLDSATARYSERVQASTEGLAEQLGKVQALGTEIDKVLRTTQSVEGALRSVSGSDEFRQTLSNLRTHLATSDELLKQLSKPRKVVFQEARVSEE